MPKVGARIMSLTNPAAKMSKSENEDTGRIILMDTPETIMRQFKRAITDSDTENCVRYDKENKPGVSNLMTIYSACTGKSFETIEAEFAGQGYGALWLAVGEAVVETLRPIRGGSKPHHEAIRPIWSRFTRFTPKKRQLRCRKASLAEGV